MDIPVYLFTINGIISIPPVLAFLLYTTPIPNPTRIPEQIMEVSVSIVTYVFGMIVYRSVAKVNSTGYTMVLVIVFRKNDFPRINAPITNSEYTRT